MHRLQPIGHLRPADGPLQSSNEHMRWAIPNNSSAHTHNGAENPWQPYQAPQRSLEHAPQTGAPLYSDFRNQADEIFFRRYATGPRWDYLRSRRLPDLPSRRQAAPLQDLPYHPPPWTIPEHGSNQQVLQNPYAPAQHGFTETRPSGIILAPLDPEEQNYWYEAKGNVYLSVLEPDKLVAENLARRIMLHLIERFNAASDIGEVWGEKQRTRKGRW
ncbi:hypothetical protein N7G274_003649 [Stereocaulon virgatum]|uniref:Uncharacterized protein n=1 Tax=Stereocaulon virgatum TaxID=373712 RepID=A0ABR4AIU2_9LECA